MVGSWAASYAAHILAATLVEEILGYNTTTTIGADVASGSVAGYYGIAGCRTFNDIADRGCMKGVTYYHVGLETWMGYPTDWDYIQNTYTSMVPKNLGSMGYAGVSGHWIPNEVQSHAYSTQGKALEFYRSWNASWNQPSNFFSSVLSIDRSKMALCNASGGVLANDAIMRRHVRWTGDIDGVVINNDTDTQLCQQTPTGTNWKYRGNLREAFSKGAFG
ncbi:unnamed protein product [Cladocopium goreaui]|uniref:TRP C-terminal domain-containing protein n=1 Tax=Cladocopium goreaui TaxID=2562237 RepID=A0A9P1D8J7_9DINO|nr:unnamed protein product [Cladocopium goreaui]